MARKNKRILPEENKEREIKRNLDEKTGDLLFL